LKLKCADNYFNMAEPLSLFCYSAVGLFICEYLHLSNEFAVSSSLVFSKHCSHATASIYIVNF